MKRPITMDDVARKAKVNQSTVSRALRNDPLVAASTRTFIQQTAKKLGYEPNAFARAMNVLKRVKGPPSWRGTLALLVPADLEFSSPFSNLFSDTETHAHTLGYNLEILQFHAPGMTPRRLTQILKTRNVSGVLVLPELVSNRLLKRLQLDWSLFPAVTLGNALLWPPLHRVSDNHFGNAKNLVRKMATLGYRRIGLCIHPPMAAIHADGGWEGGYAVGMQRLKVSIPPFFHHDTLESTSSVYSWILRESLDAVIFDSVAMAQYLMGIKELAIPEKLGIASLMSYPDTVVSGIDPQYPHVWTMAIDFLVSQIHLNQRGIPQLPQRILLDGTWHPGSTVRKSVNASELNEPTGSSPR